MDLNSFEDYKKEVILAYEKKKKEGTLAPNLQRHTPARLKKECMNVFPARYSEKDSRTFTALFTKGNNAEEYLQMIRSSDPDIFRPLNNFLKGTTAFIREEANIEILAWLIDFQPRPHRYGDMYNVHTNQRESELLDPVVLPVTDRIVDLHNDSLPYELDKNESIDTLDNDKGLKEEYKEGTLTPFYPGQKNDWILGIPLKFKKTITAFFAVLIVLSCSYIYYEMSEHQCMYWDGEKYQSIAYDQKVEGAVIVALDTFRLAHLKKITSHSLITPNDIGKVYYSKTDGKVEFYTSGGDNPEDSCKRLLPMTEYIFKKYVLKN